MQGYRALLAWREAAGQEFEFRRLLEVLRSCDMEDVAEVAMSLIDGKSVHLRTRVHSLGPIGLLYRLKWLLTHFWCLYITVIQNFYQNFIKI